MKDPEIRQVLRNTVLRKYIEDPNSKVVEELRLTPASAQIDVAVLNGAFHAFEIKSASDSLARLPNQIDAYSKIFDYVTVVTESKHESKILEVVPSWVGVEVCEDDQLYSRRKACTNVFKEGFYIAQLLWRVEIISLLQNQNIEFKSYQRNWILCELLADKICVAALSSLVREKLKQRSNWK